MTQTETLKLAISRLEWFIDSYPHDITVSKEDFLRPFKEALAQPEQETHLFEFWWSTHMPTATQKQAWDAWVSAPRYNGVGVAMSGNVTYAFDVTIEDEALKMLDDMISPSVDDECNPVRLIAGKGHSGYGLYICSGDYPEEGAELLAELPSLYTTPPQRKPLTEWQPIDTAPKGKLGYSWMLLAWGPEEDKNVCYGMRHEDKFYAAPSFYCLNQERKYQQREIEINPTHWMPAPNAPIEAAHGIKE